MTSLRYFQIETVTCVQGVHMMSHYYGYCYADTQVSLSFIVCDWDGPLAERDFIAMAKLNLQAVRVHVCMHCTYMCTCVLVCVCMCMHCTYICACVCMCVCALCMYVCTCV